MFALYRNEGGGQFLHVSQRAGLAALGGLFVGFGTVAADLDRDGDEDLAVANGHVVKYTGAAPRRQLPLLLENRNQRFERAAFSAGGYFTRPQEGRGLAAGDLDNDGDLDLAFSHMNDPAMLLENRTPLAGDWLAVRLIGVVSNREAIGARLSLHTSAGVMIRHIRGGGSYLSTSDTRAYWGFPPESNIDSLVVHWPSGVEQTFPSPHRNYLMTLLEPHRD
jgi:hypothetical protein